MSPVLVLASFDTAPISPADTNGTSVLLFAFDHENLADFLGLAVHVQQRHIRFDGAMTTLK